MKKERLRKVLVILVVSIAILMSLSISGYAATKMMDEAIVSTYNSFGSEAGIYQVGINTYMETNKTLDTAIANTRIYYGKGETVKVRFSFSREINKEITNASNLRLGLRFGDGDERVATNPVINGSYVIFSYTIQGEDFGGMTLTFIEGTVTDTSGSTITLGLQGEENMWTNRIIAKGGWSNFPQVSNQTINFPSSEFDVADSTKKQLGGAYLLDNGRIRKIVESDVLIINTSIGSNGSLTNGHASTIEITYNSDNSVASIRPKDNSSVICINNLCDIAGNTTSRSNMESNKAYVVYCDGNYVDGKYYLKAGKIIKILSNIGYSPNITMGNDMGSPTYREPYEVQEIGAGIVIRSYTIQDGDNGIIECWQNNFDGNYIADTTAPTANLEYIYLESGTAYYSPTGGSGNNTDGVSLAANDRKTFGTIWAKNDAIFKGIYTFRDNIGSEGDFSFTIGTDRGENHYNPEQDFSDYAGNTVRFSLNNYVTILCDTTGPNININPNTGSQKRDEISFTITPKDPNIKNATNYNGSGVQIGNEYKTVDISNVMVSNGTIIGYSSSGNDLNIRVMPNGDGYVSVYVPAEVTTDNLGNLSQESSIAKVFVDRKAPVIHDITGVPTDWAQEATLSVIASDEGVGGIQYSFDNGNTYTDNNTCTVTSNGNIIIKVKDSLGNESEPKTVSITKIDRESPTILGVNYHQGWTNQDVEVSINAYDNESGIVAYSFDGETWQESSKKVYTSTTKIYKILVKDKVGNERMFTSIGEPLCDIKIDKTAPTIDNVIISPETLTNDEVTITVNASDQGGSDLLGYSFDGKAYSKTNTYRVSKNGNVTITVKDNAGNQTTIVKTIENITNMKPMIKLSNNGGEYVIPTGVDRVKVNTTIEVDAQHDCEIYYAISESNTTEPTKYNNIAGNKVELNMDMTEGIWYLWTYAVDNTSNLTSSKYVSEAFTVRPAIVFDTTEESCIRKVETINGVNYVIVPVNTTANDLLKYITSPYNVTIKMSDSNKEVAGDSKLATNEMIVIGSMNEQYRIVVKGDLTGDGKVDIRDLTKMNRYRIEKETLDKAEFLAGDLIEDGKIDMKDLTKLNQYRLNKINEI